MAQVEEPKRKITGDTRNRVVRMAHEIGMLIRDDVGEDWYPEEGDPGYEGDEMPKYAAVPKAHLDDIAELVTLVVADIVQAWLDAGSERDVTLEELYDPIREHLRSWTVEDKEGAKA